MASAIAANPGTVAVLISAETPALVVVARSPDVAIDAGEVLRKLIERFGGKGGGKGAVAQGGGLAGSAPEILALARDTVSHAA
jgi:alanyl-tRNA synthetase